MLLEKWGQYTCSSQSCHKPSIYLKKKMCKAQCNKRRYICIIRSFYFGCLEDLFPILCEFEELFRLFLSSVFTGLKLFPLMYAHISVVSQSWRNPSADLKFFLCAPSLLPCKFNPPWLPWILFFVTSTQ